MNEKKRHKKDARLEKLIKAFSPVEKLRYRSFAEKYKGGSTSPVIIAALKRIKYIQEIKTEIFEDEITGGLDGVANWLNIEYAGNGRIIQKNMVSRWTKGKDLPPGCSEFFPPARSGHHLKSRIRPWADKYLKTSQPVSGQQMTMKLPAKERKEEADARTAEVEALEAERRFSGKWIQMELAKSYIAGIGSRLSIHYDRLIEDKNGVRKTVYEQAIAIGISEAQAHALDSRLVACLAKLNDGIKAEFRIAAEEAQKLLREARREQIKNDEVMAGI